MFARWGRFVYRFRWATLVVSAVLLGASVIGVLTGGQVVGNEGFGASLEVGRTASLVTRDIHRDQPVVVTSGMTLVFSSATLKVTDAEFQAAVESAIAPLENEWVKLTRFDTGRNVGFSRLVARRSGRG